jgi:ubiquinone/menaquinone biosynthesis C-methylase UbiE
LAPREAQLTYSDVQPLMHDETGRRRKAQKIIRVVQHALGRTDLSNLRILDLGCSTGFIADELRRAGGLVIGVDIDVSGLAAAHARHPDGVAWVSADGAALPFSNESVNLIVFNQIYEHVVDPDAVMAEIRRVLARDGIVYLGFGNRLTIIEPHVRLPFASWLPPKLADRYVRMTGRADRYHERLRTLPGLRKLARGLHVLDYTWSAVAEPERFGAEDVVRGPLRRVPWQALRLLAPFVPTYLWVGSRIPLDPAGHPCISPPRRVTTPPAR